MQRVDLRGTDLSGATLSETDLSFATMAATILVKNRLSSVRGLDTIKHLGPSTIDLDTWASSDSPLPESFLRGVGAPDPLIHYQGSLLNRPIQ